MDRALWQHLTRNVLYLDQTSQSLQIDEAEVTQYYLPIARYLLARQQHVMQATPNQVRHPRLVVAIAGPPGCGKSAFATILCCVLNALSEREEAVVVGLDGWHYPNAYLESHYVEKNGQLLPMIAFKGSPETYDIRGITRFLKALQSRMDCIFFPVYSRAEHEPIPDAGCVQAKQTTVILEGNYWLLRQPPWIDFQCCLDVRIFLRADPAALLPGLAERHRRGGKSEDVIRQQINTVDLPNIKLVLEHSLPAEVQVIKFNSREIRDVIGIETQ